MEDDEFNLLWTLCWLLFIGMLCIGFKSLEPCWLLIIWFIGWK